MHGSSYLPLLVCCSHLLASIWLLSASDILRLKLLAGRGHNPCVLSFSVSTTTHSALLEASPLSQLPAESLLRRIASLPCVKCHIGQCVRNRSNQLCTALVHVPSNTSACSSCLAWRVFLAIVLRLGTGYRCPEMNGGCHSYLVLTRMYHVIGFVAEAFQPLSLPLPAFFPSHRLTPAIGQRKRSLVTCFRKKFSAGKGRYLSQI